MPAAYECTDSSRPTNSDPRSKLPIQPRLAEQLLPALKDVGLDLPDTSKETLAAVSHPIANLLRQYRELVGLCNVAGMAGVPGQQ